MNVWASLESIPTILHTCRESRAEALNHFQLEFGGIHETGQVYFDYIKDRVVMRDPRREPGKVGTYNADMEYQLPIFISADHGAADADKIQRLHIDHHHTIWKRTNHRWDEVRLMAGLRELTLLSFDDSLRGGCRSKLRCQETLERFARQYPEWKVPEAKLVSPNFKGTVCKYPVKEPVGN